MTEEFDPITIEIIQNALQAAADEMFVAMKRSAMSSIIYEVLDMGTGVLDGDGEIASSGAGIPAFIGVLDKACKVIIAKFGDDISPGDVFVTNDPYHGGVTHLNDIVVAMPVFADGELVAWTANIAHNSDVGGMAPGSLTGEATEIFQEGLRLPAIRAIDAGVTNAAVMDIITTNSRMPDTIRGDVWAAIASARVGARRLESVAHKYGVGTFVEAMRRFMDYGERVARAALADLPHGTFSLSEEQDNGEVFTVHVTVSEGDFVVDLRDNPDQHASPTNTSRDAAMVSAQMIFKALTAPDTPANSGSFRPITLLTRRGSVFDAEEPAAMGYYYEIELRVFDLLWRCLAPSLPDVFGAGHFASVCGTFIGGTHPDTGRQYTIIEPQVGGWGGSQQRDGNSAMFSGFHGETYNCPAEINEAKNGLFVERMELNTAPGGEGKHTGGRGIVAEYRVRSDDGYLTMDYTRSRFPAWAAHGGREGSPNYCEVVSAETGETTRYSAVSELPTKQGDLIRIVTGNGGGLGDPRERNRDAVALDIKNGLLDPHAAAEIYGASD